MDAGSAVFIFMQMSNLADLWISENSFRGELPIEFYSKMTKLRTFNAYTNSLERCPDPGMLALYCVRVRARACLYSRSRFILPFLSLLFSSLFSHFERQPVPLTLPTLLPNP